MHASRALTTGDRQGGANIRYVKSRRVLRLEGWHSENKRLESVELPLRTFLERLDIPTHDLDLPRRYLVFAGQGRPAGGAHDLTGVFECENEARTAFHELRLKAQSPLSWAQLIVIEADGRSKPLCWFGGSPPALSRQARRRPATPELPRSLWRRGTRRRTSG